MRTLFMHNYVGLLHRTAVAVMSHKEGGPWTGYVASLSGAKFQRARLRSRREEPHFSGHGVHSQPLYPVTERLPLGFAGVPQEHCPV